MTKPLTAMGRSELLAEIERLRAALKTIGDDVSAGGEPVHTLADAKRAAWKALDKGRDA